MLQYVSEQILDKFIPQSAIKKMNKERKAAYIVEKLVDTEARNEKCKEIIRNMRGIFELRVVWHLVRHQNQSKLKRVAELRMMDETELMEIWDEVRERDDELLTQQADLKDEEEKEVT